MDPIVELRDVVKIYSTEAGEFPALRGVSLTVNAGEFLGIVGKSGAGKSTLLNMINGVDHLTSGDVFVRSSAEEVVVHRLSESDLALWRGRTMGVVYQSFQLLPMLTLIENIVLPMDLCGLYHPRESRVRALELLGLVELEDQAKKLPSQISGGQQQRAAIARALANDPPILVADEPTRSLLTTSLRFSSIWFLTKARPSSWSHTITLLHRASHVTSRWRMAGLSLM
jgi:putative ABC transport system ATP-binding protein